MKHKFLVIYGFVISLCAAVIYCSAQEQKLYFCTAANSKYYWQVLNLIGSIHKIHFQDLGEIAVYDIGLTQDQVTTLNRAASVHVYQVEKTHQDIIKPFVTAPDGREVPGWFAWKPVIIKQSLDRFPYVLYLDAGHVILRPLYDLFRYIQTHGYFMCDNGFSLKTILTSFLITAFNLESRSNNWIVEKGRSIDASKIGFAKASSAYKDIVLPLFQLSADLRYFEDDGSAPSGFGAARHDQTIFSIYACLMSLEILQLKNPTQLLIDNQNVELFLHWRYDQLSAQTHIYHCRHNWAPDFTGNIVWQH